MKRKFVKTKTELIFMKLVDQTNNKRFSCLVEENTITCSIHILTLRALKILIQFMLVFSRTYELKKVLPYHTNKLTSRYFGRKPRRTVIVFEE